MSKFQQSLTEGSVSKNLIRFSIPFLLSNLLQSIYSVADLLIVGQYNGADSITGVNLGGQVTFFVTNFVIGLATGGTVLVAQYLGAKRERDIKETIGTMFSLMLILAVVLTAVMLVAGGAVLRLIQTPPEAFSEALVYLNVCMWGTVFIFGYNVISAILRGMGDSKNPLIFVAIACGINIILDIILVGYCNMRAAGAAYATVIAQAISMIISIIYLIRKGFIFDFKLKSFRIVTEKLKLLLSIGLPTSVQNSISSLSFLIMTALVNGFGVEASAASGIVGKINGFAILPAVAMSIAVASMVGQNIGAGLHERAMETTKIGVRIALGIGGAIFVIMQLFPHPVLRLFTSDEAVIAYGIPYLRAFSIDYLIVPFAFCYNGMITGSGHTLYVAGNSIISSLAVRMPMAYLLGTVAGLGMFGIGLAVPLSSISGVLMAGAFIWLGKWKKSTII